MCCSLNTRKKCDKTSVKGDAQVNSFIFLSDTQTNNEPVENRYWFPAWLNKIVSRNDNGGKDII